MGQWNISVHGTGCHHNKKLEADANRMAAKFVQDLRAQGHTITCVKFTYGGEEDLTDADVYLSNKAKQDAEG